jgi:hypothetical protein
MHAFTAHRLVIQATVVTPVVLNEHQGSALRGALYHGLRRRFCALLQEARECAACPLWGTCPVCTLVSTLAPEGRLGRDIARPYTIQPPLDGAATYYAPGRPFLFGITLYADALRLFPYVVLALQELETSGLGRRDPANNWRRGTLRLEAIYAENPLTGQRAPISRRGENLVLVPDLPITHEQICQRAAQGETADNIRLRLLTPTRLTAQGRLVKPGQLTFAILMARLLDRLESLAQHFSPTPLQLDYPALLRAAETVRAAHNATRWVELRSYSTRQGRATPIGGLMGEVTFHAPDWRPFLPWLLWGQFTHVGKDAVKGNGWYTVAFSGQQTAGG